MRGALLDRDGVLILLNEEALYKKALELSIHGAGLEKTLAVLARWPRRGAGALHPRAVHPGPGTGPGHG